MAAKIELTAKHLEGLVLVENELIKSLQRMFLSFAIGDLRISTEIAGLPNQQQARNSEKKRRGRFCPSTNSSANEPSKRYTWFSVIYRDFCLHQELQQKGNASCLTFIWLGLVPYVSQPYDKKSGSSSLKEICKYAGASTIRRENLQTVSGNVSRTFKQEFGNTNGIHTCQQDMKMPKPT
nr:hypothetical protein Iba_chr13bCG6910 [Ipomoea batatas]